MDTGRVVPLDGASAHRYRVTPTFAIGLGVYAGYLAIFYATWAVNDVDYPTIGDTIESSKLHYALPTLFGSAFLLVAVTALGWWRPVLFERERAGPRWAWVGPIAMLLGALSGFLTIRSDDMPAELVFWSVLGGIGVGFGEEMITRGTLIVGLRDGTRTEGKVWLISTLLFSALHIPNALFGEEFTSMLGQLILTFLLGSTLYAARRVSGTLLLPILLHGLWDTSIFLPGATGAEDNALILLAYPFMIASAIAVISRCRGAIEGR